MQAKVKGRHQLTQELIESMLHSVKEKFIEKKLVPTFRDILEGARLNVVEFTYTIPASEISASVRAKRNQVSNAPVYEISFPLHFKIDIHAGMGTVSLTLVWRVAFALTPLPTQEWGVVEATTLHLQLGDSLIQIPSPSSLPLTANLWWGHPSLETRTPISPERLAVKENTLDALAHILIATLPTPTNTFRRLVESTYYILRTAIRNTPPISIEDTSPSGEKIHVSYILTPRESHTPNLFMQPLVDYDVEAFAGLSLGAKVDTEIVITLQALSEDITIRRRLHCIFTLKVNLKEEIYKDEDEEEWDEGAFAEIVLEAEATSPTSVAHAKVVYFTEIESSQDIKKLGEELSRVTPQRIAQLVKELHETFMSPHKFKELFGDELS